MKNKVELLAPAGCLTGLYGAVAAGADAVYLGGARYGARAYAENFTESELVEGIRYAHLFGRRVYLTVNTLLKEQELAELPAYMEPVVRAGLDGVIVQDFGALAVLRREFPGLKLHASTQMSVTGVEGAALLRESGVSRIVPARELSLAELKRLREESGLELEVFVHGAMCYCYSGQCLFSSMLGERSGNRGRCAQPCRLPYSASDCGRESSVCHPLSLKDLCAIEEIPALIGAGMDSFKIEGRMKKPEYAAGVTAIYRKYIDAYYRDPASFGEKKLTLRAEDAEALSRLYLRTERQNGYFFRRSGREMVTLESPAYRESDENLLRQIREEYLEKKRRRPIRIFAKFKVGEAAEVTFRCAGEGERCDSPLSVTVTGAIVEPASRQPITRDNVEKQLGKLGDTAFAAESIELRVDENAFFPLREMNELRRRAVEMLEDALIGTDAEARGAGSFEAGPETVGHGADLLPSTKRIPSETGFAVTVRSLEQLRALRDCGRTLPLVRVGITTELAELPEASDLLEEFTRQRSAECFLVLPPVWRMEEGGGQTLSGVLTACSPISGVYVQSLEELGLVRNGMRPGDRTLRIVADASFYHWNTESVLVHSKAVGTFALPLELTAPEQHRLIRDSEKRGLSVFWEKLVYGRVPMMVTANCIRRTVCNTCRGQGAPSGFLTLRDRYRKQFPVLTDCRHCMNIIYNSLPLSLHKDLQSWKKDVTCRLDFTVEDGRETEEILRFWGECFLAGARNKPPYGEYTTGHERRGVE